MPTGYPLPSLTSGPIELRPAVDDDVAPLLAMLQETAVSEWWGDNTLETVHEQIQRAFTIRVDQAIAGLLECHEESDEDYPNVAFDIFLGTCFHSAGHGRRALRMAINHFVDHGHHRFTIDPAVGNEAAIKAYSAVGFKPVGVLRSAEKSPRGVWRDALLMDLLAWELQEPGAAVSRETGRPTQPPL